MSLNICIPPWAYIVILGALVIATIGLVTTLNPIRKRTKKVADGP